MKSLSLSFLFVLLIVSTAGAQDARYQAAMRKGLEQLSAAKQTTDYLEAANQFGRVAAAEKSDWLSWYYASYCNLLAGITTEDKDVKDRYLDQALDQAGKADMLSKNNSEIYTLKGYVEYMKLSVNPMMRMSYMKASKASLERAIELNPENPRPYFVQAQNTLYTPSVFGGGKKAAKPLFEQAIAKYDTFKPVNDLAPGWGAARAKALLQQCEKD
jgi:hypothetical protein